MNIKNIALSTLISFAAVAAYADDGVTGLKADALSEIKHYSSASLKNNEVAVKVPNGYNPQLQTLSSDKTLLMMAMFRPDESPSNWNEELKVTTFVGSEEEFFEQGDIDGFLSMLANRARVYCKDDFFMQFEKTTKFDRSYVQGCKKLDRAPDQSIYEFSTVALRNRELVIVSRVIKSKSPLGSPLNIDDPRISAIRAEADSITLCDKNVLCVPRANAAKP